MATIQLPLPARKTIALIAHDNKKNELLQWVTEHKDTIAQHRLCATGSTGSMLERELDLPVEKFNSGPLGGDQQIGAKIVDGVIDMLFFFWDPLEPQPHEPDVKALLRLAVVWNIPVATNRTTADFLITSPLMTAPDYFRLVPDYHAIKQRLDAE